MLVARRASWVRLGLNHIDAWVVTFMLGAVALWAHAVVSWRSLYLIAALSVAYWMAFVFNDYCDAPYDALDPEKAQGNYFVGRNLSRATLWGGAAVIGGLVLPAFGQFGAAGLAAAALGLLVMWAYSAPPLRLKRRPLLDVAVHGLFVETFPYLVCLWLLDVTWLPLDGVVLACALLGSVTAQLEQQVRDFPLDVQVESNFTIRFGRNTSAFLLKVATALLILLALAAALTRVAPPILWPVGLIPLPALLHRFIRRPDQPRSQWLVYVLAVIGVLYAGFMLAAAVRA